MNPVESPFAFDPVPQVYDEVMGPVYFEGYAEETARRIAAFHPRRILETACGTGRLTRHLDALLPASSELTATDIHAGMLGFAAQKLAASGRIRWQQADALNLPFADASFDSVTCQFGAMFFPDKARGFSEAFRVLEPGGKFIFSVWDNLDHNPLAAAGRGVLNDFFSGNPPLQLRTAFSMSDAAAIVDLLSDCGFGQVQSETLRLPCEAPSAQVLAEAFVEGSSVRDALNEAPPEKIADLKARLSNTMEAKFGRPVRSTMQAHILTAVKPGGSIRP